MHSGEKIGERSEFLKEGLPRSSPNRLNDEIGEWRTIAELLNQHTVEAAIVAKGTGDVVRIAGKTDVAQVMKIVEFPLHAVKGRFRRAV